MIAIIILAAGASSRMGQPKQLLQYEGKSLVEHAIETAKNTGDCPVFIVLGANAEKIKSHIHAAKVQPVINNDWQKGMSSSIKSGVAAALEVYPDLEGILIMLVDQPLITSKHLKDLILAYRSGDGLLVASSYAGKLGVPALFSRRIFPELLKLQGQAGARHLIQQQKDNLISVEFPEGKLDLDTPEDWRNWIRKQQKHLPDV